MQAPKIQKALSIFAIVLFILWAAPATPQTNTAKQTDFDLTLRSAHALCAWMDASKMLSEKCSYSTWYSTIEISINMTSSDAMRLCTEFPKTMATTNIPWTFGADWQLKIFSPYSGQRPIATCDLSEMVDLVRKQRGAAAKDAPATAPTQVETERPPPAPVYKDHPPPGQRIWISPQ